MSTDIPTHDRHKLYAAICDGNLRIFAKMLKKYPDLARHPVMQDSDGQTWLHVAASSGQCDICRQLIQNGADVNAVQMFGTSTRPVLIDAIESDHIETVQLLLEHGARPDDEWIVIAAIADDHEDSLKLVQLLEAHGADLHRVITRNTLSGEPLNALSTAVRWGRKDVIEYLRSRGCVMPNETPSGGKIPRAASSATGQRKAVKTPPIAVKPSSEMVAFCERTFGPVDPKSLVEIVPSTDPAITIHAVCVDKSPCITLFTTGMSDRPMKTPKKGKAFRFAELFIQLPANWPLTKSQLANPNYSWPVEWLRKIAAYPHENNTWLSGPATIIANDDPPQRLAPKIKFTSMLALAEKEFTRQDGETVRVFRLMPLYTEERDLEIREGMAALMNAFDENGIPFVVDLKRKNVGK